MLGIVAGGEVKNITLNVVLAMQAQKSEKDTAGDVPLTSKATLASGLFLYASVNASIRIIYRLASS
jgi:hypothetical protein